MKATVTNVRSLLRSLHIDATSYFSIEKGDNAGVVVLTLVSSFLYRHDADRIESSLEDNFRCTFRRDKKGNLHMIALTSKEDASNTSQIEENEDKSEKWCVILLGGSIGDGSRVQTPYESNIDKETAQNSAKRRNKQLTPGEKSYYRMKYIAVKETDLGKGKYVKYALNIKETASNTSQIEEPKVETECVAELSPKDVHDVLVEAKLGYESGVFRGMCSAISFYLGYKLSITQLQYSHIETFIPEFNYELAVEKFNVDQLTYDKHNYWWPTWNVKSRADYFNYLIELYK